MYSVQCTLYTIQCRLCSVSCTLYTVHKPIDAYLSPRRYRCTIILLQIYLHRRTFVNQDNTHDVHTYNVRRTCVQCRRTCVVAMQTLIAMLKIIQCTNCVHCVQCTVYTIHCTLYTVHTRFTQYNVLCRSNTRHTVNNKIYI